MTHNSHITNLNQDYFSCPNVVPLLRQANIALINSLRISLQINQILKERKGQSNQCFELEEQLKVWQMQNELFEYCLETIDQPYVMLENSLDIERWRQLEKRKKEYEEETDDGDEDEDEEEDYGDEKKKKEKEKLLECELCGKKYATHYSLKVHQVKHRRRDNKIKCAEYTCTFVASSREHLRLHCNGVHFDKSDRDASIGKSWYRCKSKGCMAKFGSTVDLREHEQTHVKIREEEKEEKKEKKEEEKEEKGNNSVKDEKEERKEKEMKDKEESVSEMKANLKRQKTEGKLKCPYQGCDESFENWPNLSRHYEACHETNVPLSKTNCDSDSNSTSLLDLFYQSNALQVKSSI